MNLATPAKPQPRASAMRGSLRPIALAFGGKLPLAIALVVGCWMLAVECFPAFGTQIRIGPLTNSIGGGAATNDVIVYAVGNTANADGSYSVQGLPKRLHLAADGSVTNYFDPNNYIYTNKDIGMALGFGGFPQDAGPTVYNASDWLIPGKFGGLNFFVTHIFTNGVGTITFNAITNALGFQPASLTQLIASNTAALMISTNLSAAERSALLATNVVLLTTMTNLNNAQTAALIATNNLLVTALLAERTALNATNAQLLAAIAATNTANLIITTNLAAAERAALLLTNAAAHTDMTNLYNAAIAATVGSNNVAHTDMTNLNTSARAAIIATNDILVASSATLNAFATNATTAVSNRLNFVQAIVGKDTNTLITAGFGNSSMNGTNRWSGSAFTNLNGSAYVSNALFYVSGTALYLPPSGYIVGNTIIATNSGGTVGTTRFATATLAVTGNGSLATVDGVSTITVNAAGSATNVFFIGGSNTVTYTVGGSNRFEVPSGTFDSYGSAAAERAALLLTNAAAHTDMTNLYNAAVAAAVGSNNVAHTDMTNLYNAAIAATVASNTATRVIITNNLAALGNTTAATMTNPANQFTGTVTATGGNIVTNNQTNVVFASLTISGSTYGDVANFNNFNGKLTGSATTATTATNAPDGNVIASLNQATNLVTAERAALNATNALLLADIAATNTANLVITTNLVTAERAALLATNAIVHTDMTNLYNAAIAATVASNTATLTTATNLSTAERAALNATNDILVAAGATLTAFTTNSTTDLSNRLNYVQAIVGKDTNTLITAGFGNSSMNGTNRWSGSALTNLNGVAYVSNGLFTVSGVVLYLSPSGYLVGNTIIATNSGGTVGTTRFATNGLASAGDITMTTVDGVTTFASSNGVVNAANIAANLPAIVVTNGGAYSGEFDFTNQNNIVASAWNPYTQGGFDKPIRGVSQWFGGIGASSETNVMTNVLQMVSSGMVRHGYNWILLDGGVPGGADSPFPLMTNQVIYPAMTNGLSAPWLDFDTNYFPHGAKWLISFCHSNGVKVVLYAFNGNSGGTSLLNGTNVIVNVQPGRFGSDYYFGWLSNAYTSWQLDGIKDEISGDNYVNAIKTQSLIANLSRRTQHPFYVNAATASGYQPRMRGLLNTWRIGVGILGDVTTLDIYYTWLDNCPFWVSQPGNLNDLDEYQPGYYYDNASAAQLLVKNRIAMDAMANSPMLFGSIFNSQPKENYHALQAGYYYEGFNNPLINSINEDFAGHVQVVSSNAGVVVYSKLLSDGLYAFAVQNRSDTASQSATILATNYYPQLRGGIFTVHDIFKNVPSSMETNSYTVTVGTNDVAWFKLVPGVEQVFSAGSNSLAYFPWSSIYFPYTSDAIAVNNFGGAYFGSFGGLPAPFRGNSAFPTNTTCLQFFPNITNNVSWNINGNATKFTANLNGWIADTAVKFYGDGVLLTNYTVSSGVNQNIAITNLARVNTLTMILTNTTETYLYLGDPTIYCPTQTKYAVDGSKTVSIDPAAITLTTP